MEKVSVPPSPGTARWMLSAGRPCPTAKFRPSQSTVKPDGTIFISCLIWPARPRYPREDGWKKLAGSDDAATSLDTYEVLPGMGFEFIVPVSVSARGRSVSLSR